MIQWVRLTPLHCPPLPERNRAPPVLDSWLLRSYSWQASSPVSRGHHLVGRQGIQQRRSDGSPPFPAGFRCGQLNLRRNSPLETLTKQRDCAGHKGVWRHLFRPMSEACRLS
jgi:hypothetical protein